MMTLHSQVRRATRLFLGVACALVLLAQHVGLAHAVWHAHQQLPQQQENFIDTEQGPVAPELTRLCAFDAAFGQVLSCAPPFTQSISSPAAASHYGFTSDYVCAAAAVLAPRSRGPPALL